MRAARPRDTILAAIASMVVSWPLMSLLVDPAWVVPGALLVLSAAGFGALCRSRGMAGWRILLIQLGVVVLLAGWLFARSTLFYGLPTWSTVLRFNALILNAEYTVQNFSAPAPATHGLVMLIACVLGVVGIAVDYLAVTRRSPAMAGLALLAAFLGCAANSGASMPPIYFVAAGAVWLAMMGSQGTSRLRSWSTTPATPLTPVRDLGGDDGVSAFGARARSMAVGALAVAILLPVALPHLPTRYLLTGLGRSDDDAQTGTSFGFSQSADLARDLADRSTVPVLTYRTNDPTPQPLRVTVTSTYMHGTWTQDDFLEQPQSFTSATSLGDASGVPASVSRHDYSVDVRTNSLRAPAIALPARIRSAQLDGTDWRISSLTGTAQVTSRPSGYRVDYSQLSPSTAQLEAATVPSAGARVNTWLDPSSRATVQRLADKLTKGLTTPYDKAMAIQQYFRASGGFTYSLTLAGPAKDAKGHEKRLDPLSNFLETKRGYCVQFATGMVMLARASGIPARMVMGFLPGQLNGKDWTVRASDAHAWPELYFEGIGWTRFEPTPAERSGTPPTYATPLGGVVGTTGRSAEDLTGGVKDHKPSAKVSAAEQAYQSPNVTAKTAAAAAVAAPSPLRSWLLVLLAVLLGILGAFVVPAASWWQRRSRLRAAAVTADRVEAEWLSLTQRLSDLGMPTPVSQTPRQLGEHYAREAFLRGESAVALQRAVGTLEAVRYARPSDDDLSIAAEGRTVLKAASLSRRRLDRGRAALWPSSGRAQLREMRDGVTLRMSRGAGRAVRPVGLLLQRVARRPR